MVVEFEPNSLVTGGPISGTDPQQLELISEMMDRLFDFVCRQKDVTLKELIIFMKQIGLASQHQKQTSISSFKEDDYQSIIQAMVYDQRLE